MYVVPSRRPSIRRTRLRIAALACGAIGAAPLAAQEPLPQAPPPVVAPYRAPVIALVQPPEGHVIPGDRPVIVFRFLQGAPDDPLDLGSFRVSVEGIDRTVLFTVGAAEAWGPLAPIEAGGAVPAIEAGARHVVARICSIRGACAGLTTAVTVTAARSDSSSATSNSGAGRRRRLIELVLEAAKRLLRIPEHQHTR